MRIARAHALQIQSMGGELRLTSATARQWYKGKLDPRLVMFLSKLGKWTHPDSAATTLAGMVGITHERALEEISRLERAELVIRETPEMIALTKAQHIWGQAGWAAAFEYQVASDSAERLDYTNQTGQQQDVGLMHQQRRLGPPAPSHYLDLLHHPASSLPQPRSTLSVDCGEVFRAANDQQPPAGVAPMQRLSDLLYYSFGQTGSKRLPVSGTHVMKTSPSGGSRHPTEAYVILFAENSQGSVSHYSVRNHALEPLGKEVSQQWVDDHILEKPEWITGPLSMMIILTSVAERNMHRYRENFTYRPLHHDVGHVIETTNLVAHSLGYTTLAGYSLMDNAVSELLGNPRISEPSMGFIAVRESKSWS